MNYRDSVSPNLSPEVSVPGWPLRRLFRAAALLCAFAAWMPAQTNLVTNGGFEAPAISAASQQAQAQGWNGNLVGSSTAANPEIIRRNVPADWPGVSGFGGDQWAELDAATNIAISQDIPTTGGQAYRLTFKYANRPGSASSSFIVRWNNVQVGTTLTTTSAAFQTANISSLVATGASSRLTFEAAGPPDGQGDWIDDVVVVAEAPASTPTLTGITTTPAAVLVSQPFFFNLSGTNFDPATAQVLINGPNCSPCTITNAQLVTKTATSIAGASLLQAAGSFNVSVQNGAGPQSAALTLIVSTPGPVVPGSLNFTYAGGANPPAQTLTLTSPGAAGTQSTYIIDFPTATWITVTPRGPAVVSSTNPATVTVSVQPASLLPGTYDTQLNVRFDTTTINVPVRLVVQGTGGGGGGGTGSNTNQVLSHIADSAGWQTSIILVNHDPDASPYSLRFYGSQTTGRAASLPLDMAFAGLPGRTSLVEGTIPGGGTRIIVTGGADSFLNMGWAELVTSKNVQGSSIFRDVAGRQEAAVGLTTGVRAFLLPFDNTQGRVTSFALISTNPTQPVTVTATVRDENGVVLGTSTIALLPRGHVANQTTDQFTVTRNQRGSVEFSAVNADITGLGIRFDAPPTTAGAPRPFTSIPVQPRR